MAEKDWTKLVLAAIAVLVLAHFAGVIDLSSIFSTKATSGQAVSQQPAGGTTIIYQTPPQTPAQNVITISQFEVHVKDKYTGQPVSGVQVQFYDRGADVKSPNVYPKFTGTTDADGTATITRTIKVTDGYVDYDMYINGSDTYYDLAFPAGSYKVYYNPNTGKGMLYVIENGKEKDTIELVQVGEFTDLSNVVEASSSINTSYATDTIAYFKSIGGGTAYFRVDLGNKKARSELHDMVLCFRDPDGDMEGDELSDFVATFVSGDPTIAVETNLYGYWRDAMGGSESCIDVAEIVGSGKRARYEFQMTINEANWEDGEEFSMIQDDLGGYKAKQYPSRSAKASPDELIITVK